MKKLILAILALLVVAAASAQVPVTPDPDHDRMLAAADARAAANKRLVYDFWREVFEAQHLELADKYLAEGYIQHNPLVPTGRPGFVNFFAQFAKAKPIQPRIAGPLVSIVADGDYVVLAFARQYADPKDPAQKYTSTWFDMFRIENGRIAEHWDPAVKQ